MFNAKRFDAIRLRHIDAGGESGGSDEPPQSDSQPDGADDGKPDWKAKYEAAITHSREWEKRAKANKAAAEELEKLKEANMSEAEKTAKRIKELEAKTAAYEAEKQQDEWKAKVSKDTGVPAALLHGDTLEAMSANAKALAEWAHPNRNGSSHDPSRTPTHQNNSQQAREYVNRLFGVE